jgi:enterochelin esterase-like enzyme
VTLLGAPLVVVLAVLTAAAPVLVAVLWSRVRGRPSVRGVQRIGLLGGAQLVAVALVAALVNDYGLFYRNWSDLAAGVAQFAGLSAPPYGRLSIASVKHVSGQRLVPSYQPGYRDPRRWSTTGRLESVTIRGEVSQLSEAALVYLPPQYFQAPYARRYFPGVEVFTGYPGINQYLVSRLRYPDVLLHLIQRHRAQPVVLVMMRPAVTFPRDTECTDVPNGPSAETYFDTDVTTQIEAAYRVMSSGWGAVGDSTGGYCATKLAMLDPTRFRAAAEMSGYFFALRDSTTGDLWGGSKTMRNLNDLGWRLRHLPPPPVYLLEGTSPSEHGPDGYGEAIRFARLARPPMRVSLMTVPHGGHNIATWSAEVPAALTWLTQHLPGVSQIDAPEPPGGVDLGTALAGRRPAARP